MTRWDQVWKGVNQPDYMVAMHLKDRVINLANQLEWRPPELLCFFSPQWRKLGISQREVSEIDGFHVCSEWTHGLTNGRPAKGRLHRLIYVILLVASPGRALQHKLPWDKNNFHNFYLHCQLHLNLVCHKFPLTWLFERPQNNCSNWPALTGLWILYMLSIDITWSQFSSGIRLEGSYFLCFLSTV